MKYLAIPVVALGLLLGGCTTMLPWGNVSTAENKIIGIHSADRTIIVITTDDENKENLPALMEGVEAVFTDRWKEE